MKVFLSTVFVLLFLVVIVGSGFVGVYNNLQQMDENVSSQYAQVENQLKRRNDLIPNFVATVKGYAKHESTVFTEIANARAKLSGSMNKGDAKEVSKNNGELSGALSRLLMITENYPQLKADANFIALQDELAGTENRLAVARKDYNDSVKELNQLIRTFPTSLIASMSGIMKREYFEVPESEKQNVKVSFE